MNTPIKYICVLSIALSPATVFAQGIETVQSVGPSVKDSSDTAGSQNSSGQLMSMLTGAKLFGESAQHFSKCPKNPGQCAIGALKAAMGMLSMMQGGKHGGSKAGANFTAGITDGSVNTNPGNTDPYAAETSAAYQTAKDALSKLQKGVEGSKLDLKTGLLTTHDGKTYDLNKLGTPEGMAAAGFSPGAISGAMDYGSQVAKQMQDKVEKMKLGALTAAGGFEEGGGGGRGGSGGSSDYADSGSGGGGSASLREPTSMAGMQKNYNGEPIGVAADSIFLMMNRRYKVKEGQGSFFSDADIALQK